MAPGSMGIFVYITCRDSLTTSSTDLLDFLTRRDWKKIRCSMFVAKAAAKQRREIAQQPPVFLVALPGAFRKENPSYEVACFRCIYLM